MSIARKILMTSGGKKDSTYADDVFSTFLYKGSAGAQSINNGIDLAGEGGLTWIKVREQVMEHVLFDTERGATKPLQSNGTTAEVTYSDGLTAFNNNGFTLGADTSRGVVNEGAAGWNYASWSFRKAKGFFDVVTYTGNGSNRTIAHSLGSVPGMIIIKRTDTASNWAVYNRGFNGGVNPEHYVAFLDTNASASSHAASWNNSPPTSSVFHVGTHARVNGNGGTFVAYVFAGGESTAATARSVDFDGSNDYMTIPTHADLAMGTGDLTFEFWFNPDVLGSYKWIYNGCDGTNANRIAFFFESNNVIRAYLDNTARDSTTVLTAGQWYHIAWTRQGTTSRLFINGNLETTWTDNVDYAAPANNSYMGGIPSGYHINGKVSNFRIVKGTALYTSSFRPPTEPLTNVTNTKLLCCNNSSVTGSTVSPTTIANSGSTASIDSPFDDIAGYKFGEEGDQNLIKCGSYTGNGSTTGPVVNLGFEPQWIMLKCIDSSRNWHLFDSMRGIVDFHNDSDLEANLTSSEYNADDKLELTPTGFKITTTSSSTNTNGDKYIFVAIRRPDGYVGKPPEVGTNVFAMDTGAGSSTIPNYDSGFPVDWALRREPASSSDWKLYHRLRGTSELEIKTNTEGSYPTGNLWDSNLGWSTMTGGSSYLSWMWKRHAGFDVVTYEGDDAPFKDIPHSLGKTPEMIWIKCRNDTAQWVVGHKGRNGGVNPWNYFSALDGNGADEDNTMFNDTAPTSTHFTIGTDNDVNDTDDYIVMLFASANDADGNPISKVGSYSGSGSTGNAQNIGFQPRLLIIKRTNSTGDWFIFDSQRGFGKYMQLNTTQQEYTQTYVNVSATGFSLVSDYGDTNESGSSYIYYAHA